MPQLRKSEQKTLFGLLVEHIDYPGLQRALSQSEDLPNLDELSPRVGNLRDTVEAVTTRLSQQYKIIPLIEAVLGELDNSCPPLQQFLDANRAAWQRRRDHPTVAERVSDATRSTTGRWVAAGLTVGIIVVAFAIWRPGPPPSNEPAKTNLSVVASRLVFGEDGRIRGREPLDGAKVALNPANFEPQRIVGGQTDATGRTVLEVFHRGISDAESLKGYFLIQDVPSKLADQSPWISTSYGAVKSGDVTQMLHKPFEFKADTELELDVIPYAEAGRYYALVLPVELGRLKNSQGIGADLDRAASKLDLGPDLLKKTLEGWAERLAEERPSVAVENLAKSKLSRETQVVTGQAASSVCYVSRGSDTQKWDGTGFVVGEDLVLTFDPGSDREFKFVGFGNVAAGAGDPTFEVTEKVLHRPEFGISLLRVPGLTQEPLQLASASPFSTGEPGEIAVIGYVGTDARLPAEIRSILSREVPTESASRSATSPA